MRQRKMNWYLRVGILLVGVLIGLNHFIELPEALYGLGLGLGIALELIGAYAIKHDMHKAKEFKKRLLHIFAK